MFVEDGTPRAFSHIFILRYGYYEHVTLPLCRLKVPDVTRME
jgi:hypothetical protein